MTEIEAMAWIVQRFGADALSRLKRLVELVRHGNEQQNLISRETMQSIWARHIADSAQLIDLAPPGWKRWLDVGTGAGFPGLVIGLLAHQENEIVLVEPRRRRIEFLASVIADIPTAASVSLRQQKAEQVDALPFDIISARAVASIDTLLMMTGALATRQSTTYILPRGDSAQQEVASAKTRWHGMFHVKQSLTRPTSSIVVASQVHRR